MPGSFDLKSIPAADLSGCRAIQELAAREAADPGNFSSDDYAVLLSNTIRDSGVPLDRHRERLAALAQAAAVLSSDTPAAEELARHVLILNALFERFASVAADLSNRDAGSLKQSAAVERFLNGALKAQRAAVSTLSALKVLRDGASTPTTPETLTAAAPGAPDNVAPYISHYEI